VKIVYESQPNDVAQILGFADGSPTVLVSPCSVNGAGVTFSLHLPVADARRLAAMLTEAADAVDAAVREAQAKPVEPRTGHVFENGHCLNCTAPDTTEDGCPAANADHGPEVR
jgi:hypothetical protein